MVAPILAGTPDEDKDRLRLWIRLLRVSRMIESDLREKLKTEFDTTLPRFDVMAALHREADGMLMSDLSRFLLVSNGNVTGIVDRLVQDGLVARAQREGDRRTSIVSLTPIGREQFTQMAAAHQNWISEALKHLSGDEAARLAEFLKAFRSNWETGV